MKNIILDKKETIEEIAERLSIGIKEEDYKDGVIDGYKEAQKTLFSVETLKEAFNIGRLYEGREGDTTFEEWFERLKKD